MFTFKWHPFRSFVQLTSTSVKGSFASVQIETQFKITDGAHHSSRPCNSERLPETGLVDVGRGAVPNATKVPGHLPGPDPEHLKYLSAGSLKVATPLNKTVRVLKQEIARSTSRITHF